MRDDDEYQARGIDSDLEACLRYNPQSFALEDVKQVLAVHEGERDEDDWNWVIELKDGRFVYLTGGCDYTGWDCQSFAESEFTETAISAASEAPENISPELLAQLETRKNQTWREKTDKDMPDLPKI